jgi:hypothetical protein
MRNSKEIIKELQAEVKKLQEENQKYKEQKTYGLVWEDEKNKEKIVEDCRKKLPILERVKSKEIITDKNEPMNLMIEGDNYHALTCLNYTHRGKVDLIYMIHRITLEIMILNIMIIMWIKRIVTVIVNG